jgi:hypothetical protein
MLVKRVQMLEKKLEALEKESGGAKTEEEGFAFFFFRFSYCLFE